MSLLTPDQLRRSYLDFFKNRGHAVIPSSSLVPENDPTTLFTGSGMQPMIEYLLGTSHPQGKRIVDSQKCFRSQDIEEVGDNRHTTYFEMLGNWSLGDYFKEEQLAWFFEFLTSEVKLDPNKLMVTSYEGNQSIGVPRDDETPKIWQRLFEKVGLEAKIIENAAIEGIQNGRIFYYGDVNWWSRSGAPQNMPVGEPGGPDSEVFYDFGEDRLLHEQSAWSNQPCHVNCDCGRFLEIGNSVFMQYQKQADGSFQELEQRNVDFGGGLERILAAHHNDPDIFKTSFFQPIIKFLESVAGLKYDSSVEVARSLRVMADHLRAAVMLAADGVFPSNKEQGYFARRLVRRAIRYGRMINIKQPYLSKVAGLVADMYEHSYPEVKDKLTEISQRLADEEAKFDQTLEKGLRELDRHQQLNGSLAFKLYETFGFPFELTREIAIERGIVLDEQEFEQARLDHAKKSRTSSAGKFKGGLQDSSQEVTRYHTATHLLHAALRKHLGNHVQQRGSNITNQRLRFDFAHPEALTDEETKLIEHQINDWIKQDLVVHLQTMPKQAALDSGALAFFGQKYPEQVTVYTIGLDSNGEFISKELCGGPHVQSTAEILPLKLYKQQAIGEGLRRVYLK